MVETSLDVHQSLIRFIAEKTGIEESKIRESSHFQDDLNLPKVELAEFLAHLEDHFKVHLKTDEIKSIQTVADLALIVTDHLNSL